MECKTATKHYIDDALMALKPHGGLGSEQEGQSMSCGAEIWKVEGHVPTRHMLSHLRLIFHTAILVACGRGQKVGVIVNDAGHRERLYFAPVLHGFASLSRAQGPYSRPQLLGYGTESSDT